MTDLNYNKLYDYIRNLDDFLLYRKENSTYDHIGAIIIDAILQSGLNYKTVVFPRVKKFIDSFPEQRTTIDFNVILQNHNIQDLIDWSGSIKTDRIYRLNNFFLEQNILTESDLIFWLQDPENETLLQSLNGIGPKTVDYLKILVGIQTIAVDRHLKNFVSNAGLFLDSYNNIKSVILVTSEKLNIDPISLDYSIWTYMNKK